MRFGCGVRGAAYDDDRNRWTVHAEDGSSYECTYLILATGLLSYTYEPPWPGVADFRGEMYATSRWPADPVDFVGKRIAVVGTGSSGVQVIPEVAQLADQLTVFQRTANYVIPARNHVLTGSRRAAIKRNYTNILDQAFGQVFAMPLGTAGRTAADVTPDEAERILQAGWETGGFQFLFETFDDLWFPGESNDRTCEFLREKVRAIVNDPTTAATLCPDHPLGAKRPPLGSQYYETFNRENVTLVDVSRNAIENLTATGIRLRDGTEHDVDMIILAIGFDAGTGAIAHMDIRGQDGRSVAGEWADGPRTYLGMGIDGFPNLFTISGAQGAFGNVALIVDKVVPFVGRAITHLRDNDLTRMTPTPEAAKTWTAECTEVYNMSIISRGGQYGSWFVGANVPGKPRTVLFYLGPCYIYFDRLQAVADSGFEGYLFD
jgi:cyclohexanone monooxygenase